MILDHELFLQPKPDQKIWRYMDFTKLIDLLNSESLYFSRSDKFEDLFEGSWTAKSVVERNKSFMLDDDSEENSRHFQRFREDIAISCWHMNDFESAAMWRLYLKSNEGIAIQSTFERLSNAVIKSKYSLFAGTVNYIDYDNDMIDYTNALSPFISKRKSFEHERELRLFAWKLLSKNRELPFGDEGIKVNVNLKELVENIYVSPDSPKWLTKLVEDVCSKYGFGFNVINSGLNERPIF